MTTATEQFTCPHCGHSHSRGPINGGDVFRCLHCGESTRISDHVRVANLAQLEREYFDSARPIPPITFQRIACPTCDKAFAPARVVNGHPSFDRRSQRHVVVRRLYCNHCRQIVRWWEYCDVEGHLVGELAIADDPYTFVRDPKSIASFLRAHPAAQCQEEA